MATFYIVGTPIGNLEDITLRALKILSSVDLILCEDTRVTGKLLARHSISTKTLSYHTHSKDSRTDQIVEMLKQGKNIALVSDAGTPGISDPGSELVAVIREKFADFIKSGELKIESVPGPSALTAALSLAGVPCADFVFLGFLPHKKGRETLFREIAISPRTVIFYESPHRILKTLKSLTEHLGLDRVELAESNIPQSESSKRVTVCRELTKIYEEVVNGTASVVLQYFESNPAKVRGEFVVIVTNA